MSKPVVFTKDSTPSSTQRQAISDAFLVDEASHLDWLLDQLDLSDASREQIYEMAGGLVRYVRDTADDQSPLDQFMRQYDLSSEEGVLLMCVAEALLRIPDGDTAEKLIADKLGSADWESHLGKSDSVLVNASTWGLMLTGRVVRLDQETRGNFRRALNKLMQRSGEPVIRVAVRQAMRVMGFQFVMGRTIEEALKRSRKKENRRYRYSFDMLGEAALTAKDAERYFRSYAAAIEAIGRSNDGDDIFAANSISVKLSALHPRYEVSQRKRVLSELAPKLLELAKMAKAQNIGLTVDAEESERLQLSLDVFEQVYTSPELDGWHGFGLAIQAYQKRAPFVIDALAARAREVGRKIPVRLVKGAYWDSEIKHAQELGLDGYPVFTRKVNTDASYLACAQRLLNARDAFYTQFATHNAHTLAAIYHFAGENKAFEFQRLHGMGEELYEEVTAADKWNMPCRVYAPVGSHEDLLPYLVRRLLENGANTSFVNRIVDTDTRIEDIIADPITTVRELQEKSHPSIAHPLALFGAERANSRGYQLDDENTQRDLRKAMEDAPPGDWKAEPLVPGAPSSKGGEQAVVFPADHSVLVGSWKAADAVIAGKAMENASAVREIWQRTPVGDRARCLDIAADLMEAGIGRFMSMAVFEAGKTLGDAVAEVREAVDFCRYYAQRARALMTTPEILPGPTGESNRLEMLGRGPFVCISPWNFPLAIFTGQVAAALVTGNPVIAKPAEQTTLIAAEAVRLFHEAGVPPEVLQLVPGLGREIGPVLTGHTDVAGVAFTGSTETAHGINRALAARSGAIGTLIAETGGQNAMIADSSALPEQLVNDVITSSFHSAGQRCSALRVLFVQKDIAPRVKSLLAGALEELVVGNPALYTTDVGPVIDAAAQSVLQDHAARMEKEGTLIGRAPTGSECDNGWFVPPAAFAIDSLDRLDREKFGPLLHVVEYSGRHLDQVIDAINATGYGLTLGIHSRIESTCNHIASRVRVGNCYVNRNMIGAMVGVQPFGGQGLSGTGPKAGGPHYLTRFVTERTRTVNTAAVGGNASLLAQG